MTRFSIILTLVGLFISSQVFAQDSLQTKSKNQYRYKTNAAVETKAQHGLGFVDANGDGFNDNAPDVDGDGIPNGMDADYTAVKAGKGGNAKGFVDLDGDGINDNAPDHDGDGIPNVIDSDWQTLQSGKKKKTLDYIDLNGNGINDYVEFAGEEEHSGQQGFGKNQGESGQTPGQGEGSKNLDQNRKGKGGKKK